MRKETSQMSYLDRLLSIRIFELLKGMLSSLNQSLAFSARLFLLADLYQNNKEVQTECDSQYGEGVAEFFAEAIRHFYEE